MELCRLVNGVFSKEPAPEPLWDKFYDVIVVGMGTAGAQCAYTAASRCSLRVLGIEESTELGGMATSGEITEYYCGNNGGLYQEIDQKAKNLEPQSGFVPNSQGISGWAKNMALQTCLDSCSVTLLYDSVVSGVWRENKRVIGVTVWNDTKKEKFYRAAYVIDCTGDGIVCAMAGCKMQESGHSLFPFQPFSNIRVVLGKQGAHCCNVDSGYVDPQDPWKYGEAILSSASLSNFYLPDYSQGEPTLFNAPVLGVREGRRIIGEETVTFSGILEGVIPKHTAFYCFSNIDNHSRATAFESELYRLWIAVAGLWNVYITFPVPMEACIPQGIEGILAAGRCIAADHDAACALRMKDEMYKSGEVAAIMAWLSIQHGVPALKIPYPQLYQELLQSECLREGERPSFRYGPRGGELREVFWEINSESFYEELISSKPGLTLWKLYRAQNFSDLDRLIHGMTSPDKRERFHCAMGLALRRDKRCLPILREMLRDTSGKTPQTSQMFMHSYPLIAMMLARYLCAEELTPDLLEIVKDTQCVSETNLLSNDLCKDRADLEFQYFTHSMAALCCIKEHIPSQRKNIQKTLKESLKKRQLWLSLGGTKLSVNEQLFTRML